MYKSILLPIDLGHPSSWEQAAPAAVAQAKQFGAKIHIAVVVPDFGMPVVGSFFPPDFEKQAVAASREQLDKLVADLIPEDLLAGKHVLQGTIYKEIIALADAQGCDLIVMSSHRPEMKDYLLGPNAARVVRHANQSVFVVRA